jgi:hypothetical protein
MRGESSGDGELNIKRICPSRFPFRASESSPRVINLRQRLAEIKQILAQQTNGGWHQYRRSLLSIRAERSFDGGWHQFRFGTNFDSMVGGTNFEMRRVVAINSNRRQLMGGTNRKFAAQLISMRGNVVGVWHQFRVPISMSWHQFRFLISICALRGRAVGFGR